MHTAEGSGTDDFAEEVERGVVHDGDVVAVPADGAADVEHQLGHELQQGAHLVGWRLGGVVMACVDGGNLAVLGGIGRVEVVAAYGEALQADAEDLALDAVLHVGFLLGKNLVERVLQQFAVEVVVDADVLATVVYPEVHDAGVVLRTAHSVGNVAATACVLNPEVAYALVGVGKAEVAALGVREGGAVEVELRVVLPAPLHPALEVLGGDFVAIHDLAAEVAVDFVEVQAMGAGDEALGLEDVGTQFVDVARLARIVACGLDAPAEGACLHFEAGDVVGLPAMHAKVEVLHLAKDGFGVDAQLSIALTGYFVGFTYELFFHKIRVLGLLLFLLKPKTKTFFET